MTLRMSNLDAEYRKLEKRISGTLSVAQQGVADHFETSLESIEESSACKVSVYVAPRSHRAVQFFFPLRTLSRYDRTVELLKIASNFDFDSLLLLLRQSISAAL